MIVRLRVHMRQSGGSVNIPYSLLAVDDIARGARKLSITIRSSSSSDQRGRRPVSTPQTVKVEYCAYGCP